MRMTAEILKLETHGDSVVVEAQCDHLQRGFMNMPKLIFEALPHRARAYRIGQVLDVTIKPRRER